MALIFYRGGGCNADGKAQAAVFGGRTGQRIGSENRCFNPALQSPEVEPVPGRPKAFADPNPELGKGKLVFGDIDLDVSPRLVTECFALVQFQHKFLNKSGHIHVGYHGGAVLLDVKNLFRDADPEIVLDLQLTGQVNIIHLLLAGQMGQFSWNEPLDPLGDLAFAHPARSAAAAGRRDKDTAIGERRQQGGSNRGLDALFFVIIDDHPTVAFFNNFGLDKQADPYQDQNQAGEYGHADKIGQCLLPIPGVVSKGLFLKKA